MDTVNLGRRIAAARRSRGLSQSDIAKKLGLTRGAVGQWETNATAPKMNTLKKLAEMLEYPLSVFADSAANALDSEPVGSQFNARLQTYSSFPTIPATEVAMLGDHDLPLLGVAMGSVVAFGDLGDDPFELNGEVMALIRRPPALANVPKAFAIQVLGDSMLTRHRPGGVVVCTPNRAPSPGDDVVVEIKDPSGGSFRAAILKEFVGRSAGSVVLRQLNPDKRIIVPADRVERIYKVLSTAELLGM